MRDTSLASYHLSLASHLLLPQSLNKLGLSDEGIVEIIKEVDKDGNGTIDYNEFCMMMRNL